MAGDCDKLEIIGLRDRRQMLVTRDLAESDDREPEGIGPLKRTSSTKLPISRLAVAGLVAFRPAIVRLSMRIFRTRRLAS
jgi:hypothetical protein